MPGGAPWHVRPIKSWKSPHEQHTSMVRSAGGVNDRRFRQPETRDGLKTALYDFLIVPVTPSGEQLNGSIFRFDGAYSLVARGNACLKKSGSVMSTSSTIRCRAASRCGRSTVVSAAECSSPFVGCPGCSTYWFNTPAE